MKRRVYRSEVRHFLMYKGTQALKEVTLMFGFGWLAALLNALLSFLVANGNQSWG